MVGINYSLYPKKIFIYKLMLISQRINLKLNYRNIQNYINKLKFKYLNNHIKDNRFFYKLFIRIKEQLSLANNLIYNLYIKYLVNQCMFYRFNHMIRKINWLYCNINLMYIKMSTYYLNLLHILLNNQNRLKNLYHLKHKLNSFMGINNIIFYHLLLINNNLFNKLQYLKVHKYYFLK